MKRINNIIIFVLIVWIFFPAIVSAKQEYKNAFGLRVFTGWSIPEGMVWSSSELGWKSFEIYASYGWLLTERWQVDIEGNIGQYQFNDNKENIRDKVTTYGIAVVASYDFLKFNDMFFLYGDFGAGIAFWDDTPSRNMINNDMVPGILLYGLGVKIKIGDNTYLKGGYRLVHYSAIFDSNDSGVNTHGCLLTLSLYF